MIVKWRECAKQHDQAAPHEAVKMTKFHRDLPGFLPAVRGSPSHSRRDASFLLPLAGEVRITQYNSRLNVVDLERELCSWLALARHGDIEAVLFWHKNRSFGAEPGRDILDMLVIVGIVLHEH